MADTHRVMILWVVYSNSADNSSAPKTGYNAPSQHLLEGDNTMVSHHVCSQLVLLALLWLFVIGCGSFGTVAGKQAAGHITVQEQGVCGRDGAS